MSKVYITSYESIFARKLAEIFTANGYEVVNELSGGAEYFIDTTDVRVAGDDGSVIDGIDADAAAAAYRANVCEPLAKLEKVLPDMTGKKRICFITSSDSSINYSSAVSGFGHNMAKAAMNQILTVTKNGLVEDGYTFRLFDPMTGVLPALNAARSAFVYFTRDRFNDGPGNPDRADEKNLIVRDVLGRELPW